MTTLASRVLTLVRTLADDAVEPYAYEDAVLLRLLDDAQREIARETLCIPDARTYTAEVTADSAWVEAPPEIVKLRSAVSQADGTVLRPVSADAINSGVAGLGPDWRTATGTPRALITDLATDAWRLVPIPSADDTLDLEGFVLPAPLTGVSTPLDVPPAAVPGLHLGVLAALFAVADADAPADPRRAAEYQAQWAQFKRTVAAQHERDQRAGGGTRVRYGGY